MFIDEYFSERVSARTGGEEGQPNADSCRQRDEGSKMTINVRTSFMDGPKRKTRLVSIKLMLFTLYISGLISMVLGLIAAQLQTPYTCTYRYEKNPQMFEKKSRNITLIYRKSSLKVLEDRFDWLDLK